MRRIGILTVLVALLVPAAASGRSAAYGVAIRAAIVNSDHSITIAWSLENANVLNSRIAVDSTTVRGGSDRATGFTTAPLSGGWHTITIEVREFFETSSPSGSGCEVSGSHWVCFRVWRSSTPVSVPYATERLCVVPRMVGLQLKIATTRIRDAGCSLDSVKRVHSKRPVGTVLGQRPKATTGQPTTGTAISLVVSGGRPARTHP